MSMLFTGAIILIMLIDYQSYASHQQHHAYTEPLIRWPIPGTNEFAECSCDRDSCWLEVQHKTALAEQVAMNIHSPTKLAFGWSHSPTNHCHGPCESIAIMMRCIRILHSIVHRRRPSDLARYCCQDAVFVRAAPVLDGSSYYLSFNDHMSLPSTAILRR